MKVDLLGDPIDTGSQSKNRRTSNGKQRGYVMPPGTGPAGETCGSCQHIVRMRRYRKCRLARDKWALRVQD